MTILNNETTQEIPNRKKGVGQRRDSKGKKLRWPWQEGKGRLSLFVLSAPY